MGGLAAAILISTRMGAALPYEGLMLVMVFFIFLSGLRFYKAMLSTGLSALAYLIARVQLDLPAAETIEEAYYMYGITLVGLLGGYSLELSQRANFLTEHVALFRATRDPLTHLYNRRATFEHLERAWKLGFRDRKSVAVVLLDIDYFKTFNDQYGHVQGDSCLAEVAAAMRDRIRRPMDLVGRYGGEEFIAVLYDVNEVTLHLICEDVRRAVYDLNIAHRRMDAADRVTLSVGAACAAPAAGSVAMDWLLEQADKALYRAKAQGRNRCEYAAAPAPLPEARLPRGEMRV
jgi:diguanylate cyclase (GGDEF)-like protein